MWRRALCSRLHAVGQQQKGGSRSLCGLQEHEHTINPTGACHGDSDLHLDRINSDGSSEDSDLQLDRLNSDGSSEPLVPAGSFSNGPAGIGKQGLEAGLCQTGLDEIGLSETRKMRTQSFYPLRDKAVVMSAIMDSNLLKARKKVINGDKCCNKARRLEDYKGRNSFGCLEDCVESDDEGVEDSDVQHLDKDRRDNPPDVEMFHFHLQENLP